MGITYRLSKKETADDLSMYVDVLNESGVGSLADTMYMTWMKQKYPDRNESPIKLFLAVQLMKEAYRRAS